MAGHNKELAKRWLLEFRGEEMSPLHERHPRDYIRHDSPTPIEHPDAYVTWFEVIRAGVPGCMHGGGSPDGARMVVFGSSPIEEYAGYAGRLAGIDENLADPA
ncbi:MAG: hypothetical protein KKB20_14675 [Proteobacteria bacterium]|nr:hypothetical protein [Pseudomonadota bacterium]